jgi:homoserine kinase
MIIRKSDQKEFITKLVGADLPLKPKKMCGVAAFGDARALNSDAGFEIEIYKTSKPEAVLGVALPVQQRRFWNQC